jgi:hypothetical protein
MMRLRLQMLAQLAIRCGWKPRSDDFQKLQRAAGPLRPKQAEPVALF